MADVEGWVVQAVEGAVQAATSRGESLTIEECAGELRMDEGEVKAAMQALRDRGSIIASAADGGFTSGAPRDPAADDEAGDDGSAPEGWTAPDTDAAGEDDDGPELPAFDEPEPSYGMPFEEPSFTISRAMLGAMDDETIGKVIRAGVEGSGGDFILRVT